MAGSRVRRDPCAAPPGETPGRPLFGDLPAPGRRWPPRTLRRGHRAPARGVDVKPPPRRRPGTGFGPPEAPGWSRTPSRGPGDLLGALPGPWGRGSPVPDPGAGVVLHQPLAAVPGRPQGGRKPLKTPKNGFLAQNPDFGPFSRKMPFFGHFGISREISRGGFYINPSRRGPVPGPGA